MAHSANNGTAVEFFPMMPAAGAGDPAGLYIPGMLNFQFAKRHRAMEIAVMKKICLLLAATFALASCNTTIGLGRDARDGFNWTRDKIQDARNS